MYVFLSCSTIFVHRRILRSYFMVNFWDHNLKIELNIKVGIYELSYYSSITVGLVIYKRRGYPLHFFSFKTKYVVWLSGVFPDKTELARLICCIVYYYYTNFSSIFTIIRYTYILIYSTGLIQAYQFLLYYNVQYNFF